MGIEYRHSLVVNDADWRPQSDTAARVEAVLSAWSLGDRPKQVIDLSLGQNIGIEGATSSIDPGPGVAFLYPGVEGPPIERIAGSSVYDADTSMRYMMKTSLVVGHDYRLQWSSECIYFELVSPPEVGGMAIEANDEEPLDLLFAASFPATGETSPPVVRIHVAEYAKHNIGWKDYQGFWRGALIIDFGKDLPSFIEEAHRLPAQDFVAAVSAAFRGSIVEIGEFY